MKICTIDSGKINMRVITSSGSCNWHCARKSVREIDKPKLYTTKRAVAKGSHIARRTSLNKDATSQWP